MHDGDELEREHFSVRGSLNGHSKPAWFFFTELLILSSLIVGVTPQYK
jgi:hypothetical protein